MTSGSSTCTPATSSRARRKRAASLWRSTCGVPRPTRRSTASWIARWRRAPRKARPSWRAGSPRSLATRARARPRRASLDAPEAVRARRIRDREGGAAAQRLREIQAREASDHRRYLDLYGVAYHDRTRYDLVVETDRRTPEEVAQALVERARARFAAEDRRPRSSASH